MLGTVLQILSMLTLGGQNTMDLAVGMRFSQHAIKYLHAGCDPADNSRFCDVLSNIKLNHALDASYQVVNGKIYQVNLLTNFGKLHMDIWLQTSPAKYVLQKFTIEKDEYITEPMDIKLFNTYF